VRAPWPKPQGDLHEYRNMSTATSEARCASCAHFRNDPAFLEQAMPGMMVMGSAHSSVRGEDGICSRHDRYLSARSSCADHAPVGSLIRID
jgi:hypothetical protein